MFILLLLIYAGASLGDALGLMLGDALGLKLGETDGEIL